VKSWLGGLQIHLFVKYFQFFFNINKIKMNKLPKELILFIFELKGGLEHREIFRPVILEMMRRFLWTSSVIGYQETILPNKDFITELLICNKNNLKRTRRISM
tara:strand:- start:8802 stop:9110 length:309 start_codon:yes stop_codon:yes gene_type:complete